MKRLHILFITFIINTSTSVYSQSDVDQKFPQASEDIANSVGNYAQKNNILNCRLGILIFENQNSEATELGQFLADEMTSRLSEYTQDRFFVVSGKDIDKIINERTKANVYRTNEEKIALLKEYQVVDVVVTGTLTLFSQEYRLNIKALSNSNNNVGTIIAAKIISLNRTGDFDKMFEKKLGIQKTTSTPERGNSQESEESEIKKTDVTLPKLGLGLI